MRKSKNQKNNSHVVDQYVGQNMSWKTFKCITIPHDSISIAHHFFSQCSIICFSRFSRTLGQTAVLPVITPILPLQAVTSCRRFRHDQWVLSPDAWTRKYSRHVCLIPLMVFILFLLPHHHTIRENEEDLPTLQNLTVYLDSCFERNCKKGTSDGREWVCILLWVL